MPTYLAYQKRMHSKRRLVIRGTDAEEEETKRRLCEWLEHDVAPRLPFLLPSATKNPARRAAALANLAGLKMLDLLYMIAALQEAHGVPPFPLRMKAYHQDRSVYRRPTDAALSAVNEVPPFLAVVPSREPGSGLGVVNAAKDVMPKGELVGKYTGMIMTVAQGERLAYKKHNAYIMFVRGPPDNKRQYCINARDRTISSWPRFVNEAREENQPNLMFGSATADKTVPVVTIKPIQSGEELLISYR